jgi:hypothetical protein
VCITNPVLNSAKAVDAGDFPSYNLGLIGITTAMKIKNLFYASLTSMLACASPLVAGDVASIKTTVDSVPAPELAAKAAGLISKAAVADQKQLTVETVTAAIQLRAVSATTVVGEIARVTPQNASVAAATAAKLQPAQVGAIVKAAASAAPAQTDAIVAAVSQELPQQAKLIASVAAQTLQGKNQEILQATAAGKSVLQSASAGAAGSVSSSGTIAANNGGSQAAPVVGPPFAPGGGLPGERNPGSTGEIPPGGGRNYSAP